MLEALLHIAINGPEVKNSAGLIQTCLQHWFQAKSRRNIKAIKKHSTAVEHRSYLMDASVQVSFSVGDEHEQREFQDEELQIEDGDAKCTHVTLVCHVNRTLKLL